MVEVVALDLDEFLGVPANPRGAFRDLGKVCDAFRYLLQLGWVCWWLRTGGGLPSAARCLRVVLAHFWVVTLGSF